MVLLLVRVCCCCCCCCPYEFVNCYFRTVTPSLLVLACCCCSCCCCCCCCCHYYCTVPRYQLWFGNPRRSCTMRRIDSIPLLSRYRYHRFLRLSYGNPRQVVRTRLLLLLLLLLLLPYHPAWFLLLVSIILWYGNPRCNNINKRRFRKREVTQKGGEKLDWYGTFQS